MVEIYDKEIRNEIGDEFESYFVHHNRNKEAGIKRDKWYYYNKKRSEPTMSLNTFIDIVKRIGMLNQEHQIFFIIMYLTGLRVGELVGAKPRRQLTVRGKTNPLYGEVNLPLYVKNISVTEDGRALSFKFFKLKDKNRDSRIAYIPITLNVTTWELSKILLEYLEQKYPNWYRMIDSGKKVEQLPMEERNIIIEEMNTQLFKYSRNHCWKLSFKYFKCDPHYFRFLRCNHLSENLSTAKLKQFFGWATEQMAVRYSETKSAIDLIDSLELS